MGDFPINLVSAPARFRVGRFRASFAGIVTLAACLTLAGPHAPERPEPAASAIAGFAGVPSPPEVTSWAPAPITRHGLRTLATTDGTTFALHTVGGERTFLPGINLGSTTPGFQPGEFSITAEQYRRWLAAIGRLGIRVVRIYTIHPPAFYRELARYDRGHPDSPLYLFQGVSPDGAYGRKGVNGTFRGELRDASAAVMGDLRREPTAGRASGVWDTDVTPWLAGWIIGLELSPGQEVTAATAVTGEYFRSAEEATPTERWLAARMDDLTGASLVVRIPWALLGFADPSAHRVLVPEPADDGLSRPGTRYTAGLSLSLSATATTQRLGAVTWPSWNRADYTERLKPGVLEFRDAALETVD
ncbi:hypothetical protein [Actinoplanes sp. NPDC051851]|uniref:hypothetical protein n=1 Tax=Actinoplanes sp. NPDC051851 TaxID=3154753 RepID=UPI00343934DE